MFHVGSQGRQQCFGELVCGGDRAGRFRRRWNGGREGFRDGELVVEGCMAAARERENGMGHRIGKGRSLRKTTVLYAVIAALTALLNVAAWNSSAFSDWYIAHIFPVWVGTYGRVTGLLPFSVGEWLIAAGVVLAALVLLSGIGWLGIVAAAALRAAFRGGRRRFGESRAWSDGCKEPGESGAWSDGCKEPGESGAWPDGCKEPGESGAWSDGCKEPGESGAWSKGSREPGESGSWIRRYGRFSRGLYRFFAWTLLVVCLVMTLNCFILYHASTFSEHYFGEDDNEYGLEELIAVYNMVAEQCNLLADAMERDESGMVLYGGSLGEDGTLLDMEDMARELMGKLGEEYPRLDGFYPRPKALLSSDFMCQQYMQGYYFPFSMEANYNDVMHILNKPATMCHELAHLRGYIYEDEANFIGYLACVQSEDAFFRYAGYLSVLTYLNNDLYKAWKEERAAFEEAAAVTEPVVVEARVWEDNIFVVQKEWDRINGKALIDTEIVVKAADVFIDTNLKVNGVADGKVSYSHVVRLLLQYYRYHPVA